jgi:hypothetical protein
MDGCVLPSQYAIDYESLLSAAREYSGVEVTQYLREELPFKWRDAFQLSLVPAPVPQKENGSEPSRF